MSPSHTNYELDDECDSDSENHPAPVRSSSHHRLPAATDSGRDFPEGMSYSASTSASTSYYCSNTSFSDPNLNHEHKPTFPGTYYPAGEHKPFHQQYGSHQQSSTAKGRNPAEASTGAVKGSGTDYGGSRNAAISSTSGRHYFDPEAFTSRNRSSMGYPSSARGDLPRTPVSDPTRSRQNVRAASMTESINQITLDESSLGKGKQCAAPWKRSPSSIFIDDDTARQGTSLIHATSNKKTLSKSTRPPAQQESSRRIGGADGIASGPDDMVDDLTTADPAVSAVPESLSSAIRPKQEVTSSFVDNTAFFAELESDIDEDDAKAFAAALDFSDLAPSSPLTNLSTPPACEQKPPLSPPKPKVGARKQTGTTPKRAPKSAPRTNKSAAAKNAGRQGGLEAVQDQGVQCQNSVALNAGLTPCPPRRLLAALRRVLAVNSAGHYGPGELPLA